MINFIKDAVSAVSGIKSFLFNTDYRNNFDLQNVEFPCCVLTPIMHTNYDLKNIIRESAELQLSVVDLAPYEYSGDDLYEINKRCSDLALQVIANLQVKSKLDKELTFEFILPSGDELISGVMCNLQCTMKQGSCIGAPSYVEVIVQPIKKESITSNGKHVISADSGFNAMREVEVDVNVDLKGSLQDKKVLITENGTQAIIADEGFEGLNSVEVNSEVYEGFDWCVNSEFNKFINNAIRNNEDWEKTIEFNRNPIFPGYRKYQNTNYLFLTQSIIGDCRELFTRSSLYYVDIEDYTDTINSAGDFSQCPNLVYLRIKNPPNKRKWQSFCLNCFNLRYVELDLINGNTAVSVVFGDCIRLKTAKIGRIIDTTSYVNIFSECVSLENIEAREWKTGGFLISSSPLVTPLSIRYIIWHALNGENSLGFENEGATSRTLQLHATPYASWEEWKTTKPSVEDCEYLGVSEEEITKYGELTWEDIALNIKLITIAK